MTPKAHWCHYIFAETSARTEYHLLLIDYNRLFLADFSLHFFGTSFLKTGLYITVENDKGSGLDHGVKEVKKPLFLHCSAEHNCQQCKKWYLSKRSKGNIV